MKNGDGRNWERGQLVQGVAVPELGTIRNPPSPFLLLDGAAK